VAGQDSTKRSWTLLATVVPGLEPVGGRPPELEASDRVEQVLVARRRAKVDPTMRQSVR
jgi:hypothetical protein